MNTNDFIQKVEEELRYLTRSIWRHRNEDFEGEIDAEARMVELFRNTLLEHEKLIREEERERILAALDNEPLGSTVESERKHIRALITPDSEKEKTV